MRLSPYQNLRPEAFWRPSVAQAQARQIPNIYQKKFEISKTDRLMTAGSCFAQHIGATLRRHGFQVIDHEPAPLELPAWRHKDFGYGMYSARYGNLYTTLQLVQLAKEALSSAPPDLIFWKNNGCFVDALRPQIEPHGFHSLSELCEHRRRHLSCVRKCLLEMDVLVFTLGLTETWQHLASGRVLPLAPGVVAGHYDESEYSFVNLRFRENLQCMKKFFRVVDRARGNRPPFKLLLTVSPVPLTATASSSHILVANTFSKSVLRSVAEELAQSNDRIDYFPSYELITNPIFLTDNYESNCRTISEVGVATAMSSFLSQHDPDYDSIGKDDAMLTAPLPLRSGKNFQDLDQSVDSAIACEEELLDRGRLLP
jgi:hypothetical protein